MDLDEAFTRALVVLGGVFFVLGAVLLAVPGLGEGLPFGSEVVFGAGVVAGVLGLLDFRYRLNGEVAEFETPDPERPAANPRPGDDVDRMLYEMRELRQGVVEHREHLAERLERLALAVVRYREDCTVLEARRILQDGEWTDDPDAAAFFQEGGGADDSAGTVLSDMVTGEAATEVFEEQFRAAVGALVEVGEVEVADLPEEDDGGGLLSRLLGGAGGGDGAVVSNWNAADSSVPTFDVDDRSSDVAVQRTNRWLGVTAFGLTAVGLGVVVASQALMMAGTVAVGYTVYARLAVVPGLEALTVEREFEETDLRPGDEVEVTTTVRNDGAALLPDLRLVDAVPDAFEVTGGAPRLHTALQSGAEAEFAYTVRVERGEYEWPLLTVARDVAGNVERATLITPEAELVCVPSLTIHEEVPVRAQTTQYAGEVDTRSGGSGLEFHSVREYRSGDPMNRIDWKQVARTGDLATVDFRQEKAANVTILFDTRQSAYVAPAPGQPHAVDRSVHAASDVFGALYDQGNLVGVAAFDTVPCWLSPGAGSEHRERARMLFAQHPALSPRPPERQDVEGQYIDPMTHVRRRLPSNSQVFLFTPLADDYAAEVARRLDSEGHLVTVVSPDVTVEATVGQRLTRVERAVRVRFLRERGIRVVDWDADARLGVTIEEAKARWAQ